MSIDNIGINIQAESLESMNCEVDKNLWFMTTKDVKSGDELLTHYGFEFWVHRPLVVRQEESGGLCPETLLLLYSLHEQSSKPFNLRQFFDYVSQKFCIQPNLATEFSILL